LLLFKSGQRDTLLGWKYIQIVNTTIVNGTVMAQKIQNCGETWNAS
jgi:hypothetical protein